MALCFSQVFWLRNGVPIDTKQENHFIISSEGNLIISQVSLAFAGNYSCGAQNVAGRRTTEAALLTVFGKHYCYGNRLGIFCLLLTASIFS